MRDSLSLYMSLLRAAVLSRMAYRADFFMGIFGVFVLNGATLGTSWILLQRFHTLHGWTFWQIVFLYNLWLLGHSIRSIFFRQVSQLEEHVIQGTFDQFLTKPASPLLLFLGREVHYLGVGDMLLSATMLVLSYHQLHLHWSAGEFLWFFVVVLSAAAVEVTLVLILSCSAFFTARSQAFVQAATQFSFNLVQQYPLDMFNRPIRLIVTYILPFAFMNYYPSLYLLGKTAEVGVAPFLPFASPLVALLLIFLAGLVWQASMKHYTSTGS